MVHNEEKVIERCIDSLLLQDLGEEYRLEIFVVANACTDRTCEIVSRRYGNLKNVHLIGIKEKGKSNAIRIFKEHMKKRNASELQEERRVDKLLFMDADVRLDKKDALYLMAKTLDNRPDLSAILPAGIPNTDNKTSAIISRLYEAKTNLAFTVKGTAFSGQCYMIRNEVAQKIDIPDYIMLDDFYISERLRKGYIRDYNIKYIYSLPPNCHAEIKKIFRHSLGNIQMKSFFGHGLFQKSVIEEGAPIGKSLYDKDTLRKEWLKLPWNQKLLIILFATTSKIGDIRAKFLIRKYGTKNIKFFSQQWQTIR